jgi:Tol biopolymer transport system component
MLAGFLSDFIVEVTAAGFLMLSAILWKALRGWQTALKQSKREGYKVYWAPDNTKAFYTSKQKGSCDIDLFDANSEFEKKLATHIVAHEPPTWSPDSSKIAFVSEQDGNYEIYIIDVNNDKTLQITYDPLDNIAPNLVQMEGISSTLRKTKEES